MFEQTPPLEKNQVLYCEFDSPKTWEDIPPTDKLDIWNFTELRCYTEISEKMTNETSTFYLTKDISYADFFVILFLTIFCLYFVIDFIFRFIYKIKVNFRH